MFNYEKLKRAIMQGGGYKKVANSAGIQHLLLQSLIKGGKPLGIGQIHSITKVLSIPHNDIESYFFTLRV